MTEIALISDIHANLPALEAVLDDLDARQPDMAFCLGDLVGYAPWPNEVVEELRHRWLPTIAGNYDVGVGRHADDCGCAYETEVEQRRGEASIRWTNEVIEDEHRRYLSDLPRHLRLNTGEQGEGLELLMVHGSPRHINEYLYAERPDASYRRLLEQFDADVLAFGHTHQPFTREIPAEDEGEPTVGRVLNTGSVGKPKDGDPRAGYALLKLGHDDERTDVEFVRVDYDVERAARAIEESPLPDPFADMLRAGTS